MTVELSVDEISESVADVLLAVRDPGEAESVSVSLLISGTLVRVRWSCLTSCKMLVSTFHQI